MSSKLLNFFPAGQPAKEITEIWNVYTNFFSKRALKPESLNQIQLTVDSREVLVEVPTEKQGIHPNKQQQTQQQQHNLGRQAQPKPAGKKVDMKVFSQSGLVEDIDAPVWYYLDDQKKEEGPFSSKQMDTLLSKGVVDSATRVGLESTKKLVRIEKIIKTYQEAQVKQEPTDGLKKQDSTPKEQKHNIETPFQSSQIATSQNDVWFYKEKEEISGPHPTSHMDSLWKEKQVNEETKVAFQTQEKFVKLEKIVKIAVDLLEQEQKALEKQKQEEERQRKIQEQKDREEEEKQLNFVNKFGVKNQWGSLQPGAPKPAETQQPQPQPKPVTTTQAPRNQKAAVKQRPGEKTAAVNKSVNISASKEVQQEIKKADVNSSFAQTSVTEPNEEDEWIQVGPTPGKKKPKNVIPNAHQVPGLQTKVQARQPQPLPQKKPVTQTVPVVQTQAKVVEENQPAEQNEEDEWQVSDVKSKYKKK